MSIRFHIVSSGHFWLADICRGKEGALLVNTFFLEGWRSTLRPSLGVSFLRYVSQLNSLQSLNHSKTLEREPFQRLKCIFAIHWVSPQKGQSYSLDLYYIDKDKDSFKTSHMRTKRSYFIKSVCVCFWVVWVDQPTIIFLCFLLTLRHFVKRFYQL